MRRNNILIEAGLGLGAILAVAGCNPKNLQSRAYEATPQISKTATPIPRTPRVILTLKPTPTIAPPVEEFKGSKFSLIRKSSITLVAILRMPEDRPANKPGSLNTVIRAIERQREEYPGRLKDAIYTLDEYRCVIENRSELLSIDPDTLISQNTIIYVNPECMPFLVVPQSNYS